MTLSVPKISNANYTNYYSKNKSTNAKPKHLVSNNVSYGANPLKAGIKKNFSKHLLYMAALLTTLTGCAGLVNINKQQEVDDGVQVLQPSKPMTFSDVSKLFVYENQIEDINNKLVNSYENIEALEAKKDDILSDYDMIIENISYPHKLGKNTKIEDFSRKYGLIPEEFLSFNFDLKDELSSDGFIPKKTIVNIPSIGLAVDVVENRAKNLVEELMKTDLKSEDKVLLQKDLKNTIKRLNDLTSIEAEMTGDLNEDRYSVYFEIGE